MPHNGKCNRSSGIYTETYQNILKLKNMKTLNYKRVTRYFGYILLATVLFTSCKSEEISSLRKENADLRDKIISLEIKVDRLNKMNDDTQNKLIKLGQQENNTLDLISKHLRYNHGFK